jgi:hypothetical protein
MFMTTWLALLVATRGNMSAFVTRIPQITQAALWKKFREVDCKGEKVVELTVG